MHGALWTIVISPHAHENVHVWQRQPRRCLDSKSYNKSIDLVSLTYMQQARAVSAILSKKGPQGTGVPDARRSVEQ